MCVGIGGHQNGGCLLLMSFVLWQGCQLWMRVRREIWEARPLAAYRSRASPKKADERGGGGGGDSVTFLGPQNFWQPFSHCRHIVGVPFVHHKPLTSNTKTKWREILAYMRESVRFG